MDYTNIITAVITLLTALVSAFLIPWMKERIGAEKLAKWQQYVDIAVRAAEQLYNATDGAEKKAYVLRYLASKGIQFDSDTVDKMIESAVLTLHHELYGGANGSRRSTIERAAARRNGSSSTTSVRSALRPAWPSGSKTRRPEPARTTPWTKTISFTGA